MPLELLEFLRSVHPYDALPPADLEQLSAVFQTLDLPGDAPVFNVGDPSEGLYLIARGRVEVRAPDGDIVSVLHDKNSFGERGLMRQGLCLTSARTLEPTTLFMLPRAAFDALLADQPRFARFFTRTRADHAPPSGLANLPVADIMGRNPVCCTPQTPVAEAAATMRDRRISSLMVVDGDRLAGIVTVRDMTNKVVAGSLPGTTPVAEVMTADPHTLSPDALGSDVLHMMVERRFGHVPVTVSGKVVGVVTQSNLTRVQAESPAHLVGDIARATDAQALRAITARIPRLLAHLVGAGNRHDVVTRLITDVADAATRRLLTLAEARLGPPPVPYLWLACGSQGRQEQTGVSDQDNCLMIDDAMTPDHEPYFAALASFVCDGLDAAGYVYCPGDMMATNPRWRQPVRVWRDYFRRWIDAPDPQAQMLASVMFDLRPIGGETRLFSDIQTDTLDMAARNSIFVAHMVANSLKHTPPLGLIRGFATLRSGEHKNHIDMKMNGAVPVTDLGRIYALRGGLVPVNTRARLEAAIRAGAVSDAGGRDLLDAYDLIAQTRLEHQAQRVRAGAAPDNFLSPSDLSDFERSQLRDAFVVVRTMQSAAPRGAGVMT